MATSSEKGRENQARVVVAQRTVQTKAVDMKMTVTKTSITVTPMETDPELEGAKGRSMMVITIQVMKMKTALENIAEAGMEKVDEVTAVENDTLAAMAKGADIHTAIVAIDTDTVPMEKAKNMSVEEELVTEIEWMKTDTTTTNITQMTKTSREPLTVAVQKKAVRTQLKELAEAARPGNKDKERVPGKGKAHVVMTR